MALKISFIWTKTSLNCLSGWLRIFGGLIELKISHTLADEVLIPSICNVMFMLKKMLLFKFEKSIHS